MPNMKTLIVRYMRGITLVMVLLILIATIILQLVEARQSEVATAQVVFEQISRLISENQTELVEIQQEYYETCLHNAQAVAYMLEKDPALIEDTQGLRDVAAFMEVDEINLFDETGKIYAGTNPEYYGFTMNSGDQIGFFLPLLENKDMYLIQEITPNTALEKPMQYSAVWCENGAFIVQIGMEPNHVIKSSEKNELSYIFSILKISEGVSMYAIDCESGEVIGTTASNDLGKSLEDCGFDEDKIQNKPNGYTAIVGDKLSYCIFTKQGSNYIGRVTEYGSMFGSIARNAVLLTISLFLIAIILITTVTAYVNRKVIRSIYGINDKLRMIAEGNLDERIEEQDSLELSELSKHINDMVKSILGNTEKISYILDRTKMPVGVYEYNVKMSNVLVTEHVPVIFAWDIEQTVDLTTDCKMFENYIEEVKQHPLEGEKNVYYVPGVEEKYVRLEEMTKNNDIIGVIIDETEDVNKRRRIERERDTDMLTGLYNRRGMEIRLKQLFSEPDDLKHGALIMVDADGLKGINDEYGHDMGDIYLRKIAEVLNSFGLKSCMSSRMGGDEYVVFLYHYDSREEVDEALKELYHIQEHSVVHLSEEVTVPLLFSCGYVYTYGEKDYEPLLKRADALMYENKRQRKAGR